MCYDHDKRKFRCIRVVLAFVVKAVILAVLGNLVQLGRVSRA